MQASVSTRVGSSSTSTSARRAKSGTSGAWNAEFCTGGGFLCLARRGGGMKNGGGLRSCRRSGKGRGALRVGNGPRRGLGSIRRGGMAVARRYHGAATRRTNLGQDAVGRALDGDAVGRVMRE